MQRGKKTVTKFTSNYMQQYEVYQERQKRRQKHLKARLVLLAVVVLFIAGSMTTYHINQKQMRSAKMSEYEELESQMTALKKEEKNLKEEIELLNDDEYLLDLARSNYYFSKKGEIIFRPNKEESSY